MLSRLSEEPIVDSSWNSTAFNTMTKTAHRKNGHT